MVTPGAPPATPAWYHDRMADEVKTLPNPYPTEDPADVVSRTTYSRSTCDHFVRVERVGIGAAKVHEHHDSNADPVCGGPRLYLEGAGGGPALMTREAWENFKRMGDRAWRAWEAFAASSESESKR